MTQQQWVTLTEAALRLMVTYRRAMDLMLSGKLGPTQREGRYWFVTAGGLESYLQKRPARAS